MPIGQRYVLQAVYSTRRLSRWPLSFEGDNFCNGNSKEQNINLNGPQCANSICNVFALPNLNVHLRTKNRPIPDIFLMLLLFKNEVCVVASALAYSLWQFSIKGLQS